MREGSSSLPLDPWGKFSPAYELSYPNLFHLLDTAAVAGALWDLHLNRFQRRLIARGLGLAAGEARGVVMFWAGVHDIGKLSSFQQCEPAAWSSVSPGLRADAGRWRLVRHDRASMHVMVGLFRRLGYPATGNASAAVRAAQVVGGHHGWFHQVDLHAAASDARVAAELGGPRWQDLRWRYVREVCRLTGGSAVPGRVEVPVAVLVTGIIMVADRLVSRPQVWMRRAAHPAFTAAEHYYRAWQPDGVDTRHPWAVRLVKDAGLERVRLPATPFAEVHGHPQPTVLQASATAGLQEAVTAHGSGMALLVDRTGGGKTAAALEMCRILGGHIGAEGVLYLQSTTAHADAAYDTLAAYVAAHRPERAPVTLVRHHAWLNPAYSDADLQACAEGQVTLDDWMAAPSHGATVEGSCRHDDVPAAASVGAGCAEEGCARPRNTRGRPSKAVTRPETFIYGFDRALLAQWSVATLDQALMAVLPSRYNALRMLGILARPVVIDEIHSYSPYTLQLLETFLNWAGSVHLPVVALSASLPETTAQRLLRAYLTGAGHRARDLTQADLRVPYPGWLFAAASDASCRRADAVTSRMAGDRHRSTASVRLLPARIRNDAPAPPVAGTHPADRAQPADHLALIAQEIEPIRRHGGCALVFRATMADAQATYLHLKTRHGRGTDALRAGEELVLLHARMPGEHLQPGTRRVRRLLGPPTPSPADVGRAVTGPGVSAESAGSAADACRHRPRRLVVVTTSLLESSLDLDADLVVSDLADLPRLLQRLGRLWRFAHLEACRPPAEPPDRPAPPAGGRPLPAAPRTSGPHRDRGRTWRPEWAWRRGPVMTVLQPVDEEGATEIPAHWLTTHDEFALHHTAHLLSRDGDLRVTLPDDVPRLLAAHHLHSQPTTGTPAADPDPAGVSGGGLPAELASLHATHLTRTRHLQHLARTQAVPPPSRVGSLADLHRRPTTAGQAPTRDGEHSVRVLPCYQQPDATLTLDPAGQDPLPDGSRLSPAQVRRVLQRTVPVPPAWTAGLPQQPQPAWPDVWQTHPLLSGLVPLVHTPSPRQAPDPAPAAGSAGTGCPDPWREDPSPMGGVAFTPAGFGRHRLHLDEELGIVHTQTPRTPHAPPPAAGRSTTSPAASQAAPRAGADA
ncbi:HD domain-containing protein [Streptomyces griseoluteus]|uniref:HD domain-containing protein n=1 Tax=Streptomyces griseoluteus TaxID=29306 RepID=UPI0036F98A07